MTGDFPTNDEIKKAIFEKNMYETNPSVHFVDCRLCGHRWNALCPYGLETSKLECPLCHQMTEL